MSAQRRPVRLRADAPRAAALMQRLQEGGLVLQQEFLLQVGLMEDGQVPPEDCMEVLAGRHEIYALRLGPLRDHLLCSLDTREGSWTLLDIARGPGLRSRAYREACAAHGLVSPGRERHEEDR